MNLILAFIIIFLVIIFMVLPIGVRVPKVIEKGHASSAPDNPRVGAKIIFTALISLVLTLLYWYIINQY
jgi:predicted secreted protein